MAYKKVKRVVTLEFVQPRKGAASYDLAVTPQKIVARYKDTVVWDVQGLPQGLARKIAIGNLRPAGPWSRVAVNKQKGLVPGKPKVPKGPFKSKAVGGHTTVTLDLGTTEPDTYEYDVLCDGRTLVDPEIQIKGPKS